MVIGLTCGSFTVLDISLLKDLMQESKETLNEEASSLFEVTANSQLRTGHAYLRRE